MSTIAAILCFALTRAELIDRFKAPSVTRVGNMVEVVGNCSPEMRREFQVPVAVFVGDICEALYGGTGIPRRKFATPAIRVTIGDSTNRVDDVIVGTDRNDDGEVVTRMLLPSPGFTDIARMRIETVKAFWRTMKDGAELDDAQAEALYRKTDPESRIADAYASVASWLIGEKGDGDDEEFLKLFRSVLAPGVVREEDVVRFSSRLYLYPASFDAPFCGEHHQCSFREAVSIARKDPNVRLAAYLKIPSLAAYGTGRGERMNAAVDAYLRFLKELAAMKVTDEELFRLLDEADAKLKGVLDEGEENRQP